MKRKLKIVWMYIRWPYDWIKTEIQYRKKLKELRKKDPYIYD